MKKDAPLFVVGYKHFFSFAFAVFLGDFPLGNLYAIRKKSQREHLRIKFSRVTLSVFAAVFFDNEILDLLNVFLYYITNLDFIPLHNAF